MGSTVSRTYSAICSSMFFRLCSLGCFSCESSTAQRQSIRLQRVVFNNVLMFFFVIFFFFIILLLQFGPSCAKNITIRDISFFLTNCVPIQFKYLYYLLTCSSTYSFLCFRFDVYGIKFRKVLMNFWYYASFTYLYVNNIHKVVFTLFVLYFSHKGRIIEKFSKVRGRSRSRSPRRR